MKTLIFTLAFAAVMWGCSEETITCMPTSKSLPIEFYDIDEPVYNAQAYPGVYKPCFAQPWVCSTPLTIQAPRVPETNLTLFAVDEDDNTVEQWDMNNLGDDHAFVTIVPEEEVICGQKVRFKIGSITAVGTPPINWSSIALQKDYFSGIPWTKPGSQPLAVLAPSGGIPQSDIIYYSVNLFPGTYNLAWEFRNSVNTQTIRYTAVAMDGSLNVLQTFVLGETNQSIFSFDANLLMPDGCNYLGIRVQVTGGTGADPTVSIWDLEFLSATGISTMLYHSDVVDFQTEFPDLDMTLIRYWDVRDWDDLIYPQSSPFQAFNLWVPATFWKPRNVSEQTEHRTSGKRVVKMNSTMIKQKLFETDHLPIEFHEKILHVLSHNQVWINGKQYTNGEGYVVEEDASNRFAFQKATAWLTDSESVLNNVI